MKSKEFYENTKKTADNLECQMNELFDQWNGFDREFKEGDDKPTLYIKESDLHNFGMKYEQLLKSMEYFIHSDVSEDDNDRMSKVGIRRLKNMRKTILREIKTYDDYNVIKLPED